MLHWIGLIFPEIIAIDIIIRINYLEPRIWRNEIFYFDKKK